MDKIYMRVVDWWDYDTKEKFYINPFIRILQQKYEVVYSDKPDFIIYGPSGYEHLKYDCTRIFYTGENLRTDWNIADYGMDFDFMEIGDRHLRLPFFFFRYIHSESQRMITKRDKFCGIIITNRDSVYTPRTHFFYKLSHYKQVDSGGQWNNNIGSFVDNKIEWLKNYRFNICFENSSYPGYLTEKLFDAFLAGCIPIYWGDTSLLCSANIKRDCLKQVSNTLDITQTRDSNISQNPQEFKIDTRIPNISPHFLEYSINPKSFINAHNFETLDDLVQEVIRIDNDKKLYEEMVQEPIFLDNFNPIEYYEKRIFNFLDSIVSNNPQESIRRGKGFFLGRHSKNMKSIGKYIKYKHFLRDSLRKLKIKAHKK